MAAEAEQLSPQDAARRNIPRAVKLLMEWRGVKREQVLAVTGMSKPTLSERLSGKSPFKDYELIALAELLDVDPGVFFRDPAVLITTCFGRPSLVDIPPGQMEFALWREHEALPRIA